MTKTYQASLALYFVLLSQALYVRECLREGGDRFWVVFFVILALVLSTRWFVESLVAAIKENK